MSSPGSRALSGTRSVARKLALQALYRWQLNAAPWQDLVQEFGDAEDMARADREYFRTLVEGVWHARADLDTRLAAFADRAPHLLDPIEHAVLLLGLYELTAQPAGAVPGRHQRGGESGEALWRHGRPQVRERGAGSGGARAASARALGSAGFIAWR